MERAQQVAAVGHAYPLLAGQTGHGTCRFATPTDSVAAARSNVAAEMFRAITRTVLFDHTAASSSMNRVDDIGP